MRKAIIFLIIIANYNIMVAQDYLISFEGIGASNTVSDVLVENLTQGTSLTMNGSEVLHLVNIITGIETLFSEQKNKISLYPNPMIDHTKMQFVLSEDGNTMIGLLDISGRIIYQKQENLVRGQHTYRIQGVDQGIYIITIQSGKNSFSNRLISIRQNMSGDLKILHEDVKSIKEENVILKNTEENSYTKGIDNEIQMQYNDGDRLKLTGTIDTYSTVVVDVPEESKTITFNFIACTDGDNNNYPIVEIGDQIWMAENLKTSKYNDGTDIDLANQGNWTGRLTPAYWWYYLGDETEIKNTYGLLYNWWATATEKLCPSGWHVMSLSDYGVLLFNFSQFPSEYEYVGGGKLKEVGLMHWNSPNTGATDEFGFTALPGGRIGSNPTPENIGTDGYWWFSDSYNELFSHCLQIFYNSAEMTSGIYWPKYFGLSIRCIKDE